MSQEPPEFGIAPPLHEPPRSSKWPWVVLLVVVVLAAGALSYGGEVADALRRTFAPAQAVQEPPPPPPQPVVPPPPPASAKQVVVFEVTGSGKAFTVTATVGTAVQNETNVTLPWSRTVEMPADEASVMLVVVAGPDGAEVHGRYTINGTTVREGKASGPYGVLTITGS